MTSMMPKPKWRTIACEMEEYGSMENNDFPPQSIGNRIGLGISASIANRIYSTTISPFMTSQWPGKVQM